MLRSSDFSMLLTALAAAALLNLSHSTAVNHRHLLHQPLYPTIAEPPSPQPQPNYPKYPFSSSPPLDDDTSTTTTTQSNPFFFPSFPSPPPPPPPPTPAATDSAAVTFPANISSLVTLPTEPSKKGVSSHVVKLISLAVSLSLLLMLAFALLWFVLSRHRKHHPYHRQRLNHHGADNLYDGGSSSTTRKPATPKKKDVTVNKVDTPAKSAVYVAVGSPELHPLPPLTALPARNYPNPAAATSNNNRSSSTPSAAAAAAALKNDNNQEQQKHHLQDEEYKYEKENEVSSQSNIANTNFDKNGVFHHKGANFINPSFNWDTPSQTHSSHHYYNDPLSPSSVSVEESVKSPDCPFLTTAISHPTPPPPPARAFAPFHPTVTDDASKLVCSPWASSCFSINHMPAENDRPGLAPPDWSKVSAGKPKLKPSPWDKVPVREHFKKSNSFQLDDEMIGFVNLFTTSSSDANTDGGVKRRTDRILDPDKSRKIAILLRALDVTVDEVCKELIEGNTDGLGSELLESLLKMAPTEKEEQKLKELIDDYDDYSLAKNGTSERFLRAVLEIPFSFKRIDAMLYVVNFDSEVEHLKTSFDTLESACKELKSSRMFRKLLEATLNAGNHLNIGSYYRGGPPSNFKLESLLELAGVKGSDGRTTLLHFVVQDMIQVEGLRLLKTAENNQCLSVQDEIDLRKLGLQVVSRLGGELTNVKKAATVDRDALVNDVMKLCAGVGKVREVVDLHENLALNVKDGTFSDNMNEFLKRAEPEIVDIQAKEGITLSMVKGLTEYFHGGSGKEEAHQLRIFTIVRDFLSALDQVCKDVGKTNERAMMNSACLIQIPTYPSFNQVFPSFDEKQQCSSSDNDSSSSSY